jgi:hypothetical protein
MSRFSKTLLAIEFALLCIALPTIIIVERLAPFMFFFLWGAALYTAIITYRSPGGREFLRGIWRFDQINRENLGLVIPRWILACIGMTIFLYVIDPDRLFALFDRMPIWIVPLLILGYTGLSALPQEFIFCAFFFRRYGAFFTTTARMIWASSLVFAYAHVLFINWVAPLLSIIAGLIFASTYQKTKSLALVTLEHGLYGAWLFIVGLGWYFYHGAVGG